MVSKKVKVSVVALLFIIGLAGFAYFILPFEGIPTILSTTLDDIPFQEVVLEKDSTFSNSLPAESLTEYDSISHLSHPASKHGHRKGKTTSNAENSVESSESESETTTENTNTSPTPSLNGKELFTVDFKQNYTATTRVRFTEFFNTFQNGDYMSGKEFSGIYKRDPTLNKVSKSTICSFIEKHIRYISRKDNSLIIHTVAADGIHTKIKIPFVEDLRIDIKNGSSINLGKTFASTEPAFLKSILLPVKLNDIDIIHNGEVFPKSGFISGNYYFIDYSKTKMAYKVR